MCRGCANSAWQHQSRSTTHRVRNGSHVRPNGTDPSCRFDSARAPSACGSRWYSPTLCHWKSVSFPFFIANTFGSGLGCHHTWLQTLEPRLAWSRFAQCYCTAIFLGSPSSWTTIQLVNGTGKIFLEAASQFVFRGRCLRCIAHSCTGQYYKARRG